MYSFRVSQLVCAAIALISPVYALGINCRGSSDCTVEGGENIINPVIAAMESEANGNGGANGNNYFYDTGAQIACGGPAAGADGFADGSFCIFFQTAGANGTLTEAIALAREISDHGCTVCGSVPTMPGNDVSTGELTINYVNQPSCGPSAPCDGGCTCVVPPSSGG